MLILSACGDDGGSSTATDSTDSTEQPAGDASGISEADSGADDTPLQDDLPLDEDPSLAADGDNMLVDDPGLDSGGDADPAAGGSTFNPVGGSWTLESLTIEGDMAISLEEGDVPTIEVLGTDLTGHTGCNGFGGTTEYDITGDSFSAEVGAITEIGCENDTEKWFLQALGAVNTFTSEPGVLILSDNAEFPTEMRFVVNAAPENPEEE